MRLYEIVCKIFKDVFCSGGGFYFSLNHFQSSDNNFIVCWGPEVEFMIPGALLFLLKVALSFAFPCPTLFLEDPGKGQKERDLDWCPPNACNSSMCTVLSFYLQSTLTSVMSFYLHEEETGWVGVSGPIFQMKTLRLLIEAGFKPTSFDSKSKALSNTKLCPSPWLLCGLISIPDFRMGPGLEGLNFSNDRPRIKK